MQLFYNPALSTDSKVLKFDKNESRHIIKSLRKTQGDTLFITNGKGLLFRGEIALASDKNCTVNLKGYQRYEKPNNYSLHLAVAPTKMNDRFEWMLEKATEIGIDEITPVICSHSERKVIRLERMQKIIEAAAKQSLKYHFPILHEPVSFKQFMQQNFEGNCYIGYCDASQTVPLKSVAKKGGQTTIIIGPEGDFSLEEIELSLQHKFIAVSLGESRLRTETAAMVAVHSIAFLNE